MKYEIDFIANWSSPHEGNFLYISKILGADCAIFKGIISR